LTLFIGAWVAAGRAASTPPTARLAAAASDNHRLRASARANRRSITACQVSIGSSLLRPGFGPVPHLASGPLRRTFQPRLGDRRRQVSGLVVSRTPPFRAVGNTSFGAYTGNGAAFGRPIANHDPIFYTARAADLTF
jgi:hypothetical protein